MDSDRHTGAARDVRPDLHFHTSAEVRLQNFEKRQAELWRLTFFLLLVVTIVFAWLSWGTLRLEKTHVEAMAYTVGLVVLVALFGIYSWRKTQEISELRGLIRGFDQKDAALPSDRQMEQLFQVISRSQQGFRDLIDSFDDILLALSLDGEIRAANRSFCDLLNASFQDVIGKPIRNFLEDANGEPEHLLEKGIARFVEQRQWNGVVQLRLKFNGSVHYFDCAAHAMIRDDKVHGLTILARDVTAVRRNEARFTELFETLQEGIYIVTAEGDVLEVNPSLVRMLGYESREQLLAQNVTSIFVNEEERTSIAHQVDHQPTPQTREITLQRKDGKSIVCLNTSTAVRDSAGKIIRYQGALVDITERREMEKRLHKQQEFARRLVDSFPDLIFVVDNQRRYTFVSPKVLEVLGYSVEESIGMVFGDRTHPEERGSILSMFEDLTSGRKNFASIEVQVRHKSGEWRRLRCHFSPLFDESGKIEGVVISGRDVTEVKRLEEQLIQAEKLAAMGQMLAGVAHELNNPLTAILGVSELLRDRPGTDDATKRQLEITHRQARRAARIVQNLLEFSRPASPQKKSLDVNQIIDRTLQLHDHSLRKNGIEVDFRSVPDLPLITGDANQLIQVFLNLISNAEQAIRASRGSGHIRIRLGKAFKQIFVVVQDDGPGIKPDALPRIFDPFFTTKRPGGGTGLGLSICMSIVREHGGNIEAETLPNSGAAFTVYLPAMASQPGSPVFAQSLDTGSGELMAPSLELLHDRSVLVLDDDDSIRMLLTEGLAAHNLRVDSAASAEQALNLILGRKYDVVLCDLQLSGTGPNSDGRNVAERLKIAAGTNRPEVIFMSGDIMSNDDAGWMKWNKLQKPFRISDVLTLLIEIFSQRPVATK